MASTNVNQPAPPVRFNLDWRRTIDSETIIEMLDDFLTTVDSSHRMKVNLVNSRAKSFTKAADSGHTSDMILQTKSISVRRWTNGPNVNSSTANKYIARMIVIVKFMMNQVANGSQCTPREAFYRLGTDDFTDVQIKQCARDLALTLDIHPYSLGIVAEANKSFVRVPVGCDLLVTEVNDIFAFARGNPVSESTYPGGRIHTIMPMYSSVKVNEHGTRIRAVVITEHRSVKEKIEQHLDTPGFGGILLVMTGGFEDAACREFIHLLAINPVLARVPFVWMSDCDAHAIQMYSVLKHGSFGHAYANPTMVCPQLLYGGLTWDHLVQYANSTPALVLEQRLRLQPGLSDEEKTSVRNAQQLLVDNKLLAFRRNSSHHANRGDDTRIKGIENGKLLELPGEEAALSELRRLKDGGPKASFLQLENFNAFGCAFLFAEQVAMIRGDTYEHPVLFGNFGTNRANWLAIQEQAVASEMTVRVDADVEMDMDMFIEA